MVLPTPFTHELIELTLRAPTVVDPGDSAPLEVHLQARQDCVIHDITFTRRDVPARIAPDPAWATTRPLALSAGAEYRWRGELQTTDGLEGYGLLLLEVNFGDPTDPTTPVSLHGNAWLSVFAPARAATDGLDDALRERLIGVTNYRPRNGHIFLADYAAYFRDFLHIEVPPEIASALAEDFGLPDEGLPVDEETRYEILIGRRTFYGIEYLELIAEEECNESDDRFDAEAAREVSLPQIP